MTRIELMDWERARPLAMPIRETVFVAEQGVPAEIEMDEWDARCLHAVAWDGAAAVGTGRLLPDAHIGRMAVLKESRGKGVGSAILSSLIGIAEQRGDAAVALSAQTHAIPFYRAHGFAPQGGTYLEAGIPHQAMTLTLGKLLLAECARLAGEIAPRECMRGPWGEHCMPMHAAWPALRLTGHVGGPAQDSGLFTRAFALLQGKRPDILISGASDHGILEQVLRTAGESGVLGAITVLDRCDTPLHLNRWYAGRVGRAIETRRSDIIDFAPGVTYDAIFAHSFLEHLPRERWAALCARWQALLKPGGVLAAVFRVLTESEAAKDTGGRRDAADFLPHLQKANAELPARLQLPADDIAARMAQHWQKRKASPVRSSAEVETLLAAAGFEVLDVDQGKVALAARPGLPSSTRMRLVARRRG